MGEAGDKRASVIMNAHRERARAELRALIQDAPVRHVPTVNEVLAPLNGRDVFIYGAGSFGREMLDTLSERGVPVQAFLDRAAAQGDVIGDIPVIRPDDASLGRETRKKSVVIFSVVTGRASRQRIYEDIRGWGFTEVLDGQGIRCRFVGLEGHPGDVVGADLLQVLGDDIVNAVDLWADNESLDIYRANVSAHLTRDYSNCPESEEALQYFVDSPAFRRGFSRFVDCGGYRGDTLQDLVRTQGPIQAAASFEPNIVSYRCLCRVGDQLKESIGELFLFPCAVSQRAETLPFQPCGGSSRLASEGTEVVQCVALDEALKGFSPTFIKMDVEGAERRALIGAQNMIRESRPDLAVCLYHYINHLWEVPSLVHGWDLGYRFHLRAHSSCTMETVMYAVCQEGSP